MTLLHITGHCSMCGGGTLYICANYCHQCGRRVCHNCGEMMDDGRLLCKDCNKADIYRAYVETQVKPESGEPCTQ